MKIKVCCLAAAAAVIFRICMGGLPVRADDCSLGRTPEGVFPMHEEDIEMESENIVVDLETGKVKCSFTFHNTGEGREILIGFPGKLHDRILDATEDEVSLELKNFRAFAKGRELQVAREDGVIPYTSPAENGLQYKEWFSFKVPFKADERIVIQNTYAVTFTHASGGYIRTGYVLKTGALWKGPIGKARVEFRLGSVKPWQVDSLRPGGFKFKGNSIVWERTDFEPLYDLSVSCNTLFYTEEFINSDALPDEKAPVAEMINRFKDAIKYSTEGNTGKLLELYNSPPSKGYAVLRQYLEGFIPEKRLPVITQAFGEISVEPENGSYLIQCETLKYDLADIRLLVTHKGNGSPVVDGEFEGSSCYMELKPGVEYDISCAARDWMDRTYRQSAVYRTPGPAAETSAEADALEEDIPAATMQTQPPAMMQTQPPAAPGPSAAEADPPASGAAALRWIIPAALLLAAALAFMAYRKPH